MSTSYDLSRCSWPGNDPLMVDYHDKEWGNPLREDRKLFEFMLLDSFQAGLSWSIVLKKREGFRKAFAGFDPSEIALFDENKISELITNDQIIRNKIKIRATIGNAQKFLEVQKEFSTFHHYIWSFVNFKPIVNSWETEDQIPATSPVSDVMSADLKRRGFKFAGSTICYAFMQAAGLVNDHLIHCFRHPANQK
ncbi:MAG: DNA-3-methyladenine glycosylase I [FCB group bacterium]|nr:DNA-3-methyladenine glycosylase I [FCB group bacterium]